MARAAGVMGREAAQPAGRCGCFTVHLPRVQAWGGCPYIPAGACETVQAGCRILVVDRRQDELDSVVALLESNGCIVSATLNAAVAVDLVSSASFDAMVVGSAVSRTDFASLREDALRRQPDLRVVESRGTQSVLTLVRQAFGRTYR